MTTGRINQDLQTHRSRGAGALFGPKESGDKAVSWNSPLFRPESGKLSKVVVWSPLSTENLRIWRLGHPTLQSDTKNGLFGLDRFERFFVQKTEPDGAVTSVVTSSAG